MKRTLTGILYAAVGIVLVTLLVLVAVVAFPGLVGGSETFVVTSGSMSPTIEAGDVIVTREVAPAEIETGDVITFTDGSGTDTGYVTHRVVDVVEEDDERYFQLQGDANDEPDEGLAPADYVQGELHLHLPYLGHLLLFARSTLGLALLVFLPGFALVVAGSWQVLSELGFVPDGDHVLESLLGPDEAAVEDGGDGEKGEPIVDTGGGEDE